MEFVQANIGWILTAIIFAFAWWRGGFERLHGALEKVEAWYDRTRLELEERQVYDIAKKAYEFANDKARMLAKKTDTDVDDKIVDKAAVALEWALKVMKRMGLNEDGAEDTLKGYFGQLHEAENKAKELAGKLPVGPGSSS